MIELDPLDKRIVAEMQRDASLSSAQLAERVGSTTPSCWRRVRALQESGIFRKTVWLADQTMLGHGVNVLCHVRMRDYAPMTRNSFEAFVGNEKRIMECYAISGEWDYMMRVLAQDVSDYDRFLTEDLLSHPSVANVTSQFALRVTKYETEIPL